MTIARAACLLAAAALLGACVSLEEQKMAQRPIEKGQRLLVVVFSPPGPIVTEVDSKGETAAKIVPGLGLVVKDAQDSRDLKASQDLGQYLPRWQPAEVFASSFTVLIQSLGQPAKMIAWHETGIPAADWVKMNRAADVNDWQQRHTVLTAHQTPGRNYSRYLTLDDTVVLEVNLMPGVESVGGETDYNYKPVLKAVTKLYRANTMRQLWRRENAVEEPAAARTLYDWKVKPGDLIFAWNRLLPMLGQQITEDFRKNLAAAGVPLSPAAPSYASGPADLPSGEGWAPAPQVPPSGPAAGPQLGTGDKLPYYPKPSTP